MYRPSYEPSYSSPQPNQGYSPLNRINFDMNMENLFNTQDYYASQGSGSNHEFYMGPDYSLGLGSAHGSHPVEDDSPIRIRELEAWSLEFDDEFCDTSSVEESVGEEKNGPIQEEDLDHVSESSCMKENNEAEIH
ncbi:hypothetical protein Tco_1378494 [Tanacetum coccineum]